MIVTKQYVRTDKYRPQIRFRKYEILQPDVWQQLITENLWNMYKINCAYNFKQNKVYNNTIRIEGKCNCGSVINGVIDNLNFENDNIMICKRTKGTGICGKRILRNPEQAQIGKILWEKDLTAEVYRTEQAEELMTVNDPEPPHLYSAKTIRSAKKEYSQSLCFDKEPFQSLLIAQESELDAENLNEKIQNLSVNKITLSHSTNTNACQSGDKPTNNDLCIMCNKSVHMSSGCSQIFNVDEESKKINRICTLCQNTMSKKDILNAIDSNEVENWRGLNTLKSAKKKSRYLDKNNICIDVEKTKLRNIPILQNGSNITLKPINIKGKKLSLVQTCAFDSIFQIFLLTLFRSEDFKTVATDLSNNNIFFKIILDTFIQGISENTYYLRGIILSDFFEAKETFDNCFIINCEVSVGYLCKKLFYDIPSLKEITSCDVCDNVREKSFPTIQVKLEDLLHFKSLNVILDNFILKPKRCNNITNTLDNAKCIGTQTTYISDIGPFLILEIYNTYHSEVDVELNKIPQKLQCLFMPKKYILRGVIDFKLPACTPSSERNIVGHFTAVTYHGNNTWIEYDDCRNKHQRLPETHKANVQVAIYSK